MTWLSWRQLRAQAAALYLAAAVVAVYAALTRPRLRNLATAGGSVFDRMTRSDSRLFYAGVIVMAVVSRPRSGGSGPGCRAAGPGAGASDQRVSGPAGR
jgi:hypothetical protein